MDAISKDIHSLHCTITGHGLVDKYEHTHIPDGITLKFYAEDGEILDVKKATAMWANLQYWKKREYSDKPKPTVPDKIISGKATIKKLWIGFPTKAEGWIAGVYHHGGDVNKKPDLIDMHNDPEIKKKNKDKTLDLDFMLTKIKDQITRTHPETKNIIVHVLTCLEHA